MGSSSSKLNRNLPNQELGQIKKKKKKKKTVQFVNMKISSLLQPYHKQREFQFTMWPTGPIWMVVMLFGLFASFSSKCLQLF